MKTHFILLVCIFSTTIFSAQTASVRLGSELIKPRKTEITTLIGADQDAFYCIRSEYSLFRDRPLSLEKYSKEKLGIDYIRPFKIPEVNGRDLKFEKAFLLNGLIMIFASRYDRELDKNILYLMRINAQDGAKLDTPKEIDHIDADKKSNRGSFDFVLSNDSSKILIMHNEPYEKYDNQKFSYRLIDSEGKSLWFAAFELPYRDKYFSLGNYKVDNDGKLFMLANITKERSERERKQPTYTYDLISYDYETKSLKETPISLREKYISDISFALVPGDKILIGGFYSNKSRDGLAGAFYVTIDENDQHVINSAATDFSTEFMAGFMSQRRAERDKELYNYKIDYLVTKSDGGIYMVAEQYFINVVTVCQPRGGCTTTYYYNYNNIIVANFNADASLKWVRQIPKTQVTANDYGFYSSYSFNVKNEKLYFLYNDHPKNYTKPKKYPRNGITKKMIAVLASIDKDGNLERNTLFTTNEEKVYTRPKISVRLSADQSLFYAIKRKKYKFGIITYP